MAVSPTNGYCTGDELKAALAGMADTSEDVTVERAIETASRQVDRYCGRVFYAVASSTRYYTPTSQRTLRLTGAPEDIDVRAVSSVTVDTTGDGTFNQTWTEGTHFVLGPRSNGANSRPYRHLEVVPSSGRCWPVGLTDSVKVVGTFGWDAVPEQVREATIRQAVIVFQTITEGTAPTFAGFDGVPRASRFIDGMVQQLLDPFRVNRLLVA